MTDPKIMQRIELTELEKENYHRWRRGGNDNPLPLGTSLQLYELFLNAYSCEEICRINGEKYPLGQIVDARIRYDWDRRKQEQIESLYSRIEDKVVRVKNNAVSYLADLLAAAHKLNGEKVQKFLMEGNPEVLDGLKLSTIKDYREIVNMFILLTGGSYNLAKNTNNPKFPGNDINVKGEVKHIHVKEEAKSKDLLSMIDEAETVDAK